MTKEESIALAEARNAFFATHRKFRMDNVGLLDGMNFDGGWDAAVRWVKADIAKEIEGYACLVTGDMQELFQTIDNMVKRLREESKV